MRGSASSGAECSVISRGSHSLAWGSSGGSFISRCRRCWRSWLSRSTPSSSMDWWSTKIIILNKSGPGESWCAASRDTGPLVMPSYPLSFRELNLSEARFPRRTPLGFSVNRGSGSPLAPRACSLASTDGYLFAKRAGKACLEVLSSTSSRKKETPFEVLRRGVRGRRSQLCRPRIGHPRRKTYNLFYSYPTYDAGRRTLGRPRPGAVRQQAGPTSQDLHRRSWGGLSPPSFLV